jgi:hypothetical protein
VRKLLLAAGAALALAGPAHADDFSDGYRDGLLHGGPVLPACESPRLTQTLRQVAMKMGVALYNYNAVTMSSMPDTEWCRAVAWTSSGKCIVNFNVVWTNRDIGQYLVTVTGYSRPIW